MIDKNEILPINDFSQDLKDYIINSSINENQIDFIPLFWYC